MSPLTLTGSDELELFYKKPFWFSYSSINKLLFSPRMFYSHYVLNQREDSTDAHLVAGRVLHCLLFEPEAFDNQFILLPGKLPSGNNKQIIDNIFKYHLTLGNNTLNLSDYSQEILTQLLTVNLYQNLKTDQQRIDKLLTQENLDYFEFLKSSLDKTVVDEPTLAACRVSVEVLRANQDIRTLLQLDKEEDDKTIEVYNELFIKAEPSEQRFGYHGMLDNVVIDHNTKTIFINDLKTIGKSIQEVESEFAAEDNFEEEVEWPVEEPVFTEEEDQAIGEAIAELEPESITVLSESQSNNNQIATNGPDDFEWF